MAAGTFNRGFILCTVSVLFNAIATTISKFALESNSPIATTALICFFSTILSYTYIQIRKHKLTITELQRLLPIAIFNSIATILLYSAIANLNPITIGFAGRFYVVFTILLSAIVLKERISWQEIILIFATVSGIFLFVSSKTTNYVSSHWLGVTQVLLYTFLFALVSLFVKKNVYTSSSVTILFYNNLFGTIGSLLYLYFYCSPISELASINSANLAYAFLTASITLTGLVFFFNSFRLITFKLSNIIRSTSPLFITIVSWPFFPIKLTVANTSGGLMVLLSVVALSFIEKRRL